MFYIYTSSIQQLSRFRKSLQMRIFAQNAAMHIASARFRCSSTKLSQCPDDGKLEFAFIGRSNVGKSSLINMLTDSPGLAKVSSTPGKTKLINHFLINDSWYIVDLPGYGYARVSKTQRKEFSELILDYVLKREQMYFLFVLLDVRLEPQKIDLDFIELLGSHGVPFGLVFTKCDKLSANQTESSIARYKRTLRRNWEELPPIWQTSSEKRQGREQILGFIGDCLEQAAGQERP